MADAAGNVNTPRLNVISFGVFILSVALAVIAGVQTKRPVWPVVIMLVGARSRAATGAIRGTARTWTVLDRAVRRVGFVLD